MNERTNQPTDSIIAPGGGNKIMSVTVIQACPDTATRLYS